MVSCVICRNGKECMQPCRPSPKMHARKTSSWDLILIMHDAHPCAMQGSLSGSRIKTRHLQEQDRHDMKEWHVKDMMPPMLAELLSKTIDACSPHEIMTHGDHDSVCCLLHGLEIEDTRYLACLVYAWNTCGYWLASTWSLLLPCPCCCCRCCCGHLQWQLHALLLLLLLVPWVELEAAATSLPLGLAAAGQACPPHKLRVSRKMPNVRDMDEKLMHDLRACACEACTQRLQSRSPCDRSGIIVLLAGYNMS